VIAHTADARRPVPYRPVADVACAASHEHALVTAVLYELAEQGRHRRAVETAVVAGSERRADRGQVLAAAVVLLGVVVGLVAILAGAPVPGAGLAATALGSGALAYGVGGRAPRG
jgi:hypothetical protein